MSSSGEGQTFKMGAHVDASDGRCGHLTAVILDPADQSLTHLVVEPGHHEERARLVPVDLLASVDDDLIGLDCTKLEFEQLDSAADVTLAPEYRAALSSRPLAHHRQTMSSDYVPPGKVEMRRGDPVHASDGWIGAVQDLVVDPVDHHVTHVILQEGHVWGRKDVAIPIGGANCVGDSIRVDLTTQEIKALPPVSLRSRQ
jgi:sporulation protein YlmC with PRC-barrel domain